MISLYEYPPILYFCTAVALVFGAVMGSFLNCAAWRIAHGESFLRGRSRCPRCGHVLGPAELVPILSWLLQKGRCRACGEKISARYPLTEAGFALATALCLLRFGLTGLCLRNYVFLCCLFCLSLVDLECFIIPDGCLLLAAGAWLLSVLLAAARAAASGGGEALLSGIFSEAIQGLSAALLFGGGLLIVSLIMDRVLGRDSLGGGDIKLIAVAGLYLGPVGTLFAVMLSCVFGLAFFALRTCLRGEGGAGETDTGKKASGEEISKTEASGAEESGANAHGTEAHGTGETGAEAYGAEVSGTEAFVAEAPGPEACAEAGDDEEIPDRAFPFGPSIALAAAVMLFFGGPLVSWYLGLLGL